MSSSPRPRVTSRVVRTRGPTDSMLASLPNGRLHAAQRGAVLAAKKVASKDLTGRLLGLPSRATEHRGLRDGLSECVEDPPGPPTSGERVCQKLEHCASRRQRARAKTGPADVAGDEHEPHR